MAKMASNHKYQLRSKKSKLTTTIAITAPKQEPNPPGEKASQKSHISILNPDTLIEIFSYLPTKALGRAARVCQHWRTYAYSKQLWKDVEFTWKRKCSEAMTHSLLTRGIQRIRIKPSTNLSLNLCLHTFPRLESLTVIIPVGFKTSSPLFPKEKCNFSSLRELHVETECSPKGPKSISKVTLDIFEAFFPNVEVVYLHYMYLRDATFNFLGQWERLREVTLIGLIPGMFISRPTPGRPRVLESMTLEGINDFNAATMEAIVNSFPNLRSMQLEVYVDSASAFDPHSCLEHLKKLKKVKTVILSVYMKRVPEDQCKVPEAVAKYRNETGVDLVVQLRPTPSPVSIACY